MGRNISKRGIAMAAALGILSIIAMRPLFSQEVTGSIVGKVLDAQGLVLPGVTITVTSPQLIRASEVVTTGGDGIYRLRNLPPGTYTVIAEFPGFRALKREGILLQAGRTLAVDFQLQLSGMEETVTVTGESPIIDIENTRVGVTVEQALIDNIPTGRRFQDILTTQPGVVESPYTFAPTQSVHGSHVRANYYAMDGFQMQDTTVGYAIGEFSYDSLQEVQITTGGISAEFGQASGGVFNFITKSGGNDFQGGVRYYLNDEALNSDNVSEELKALGFKKGTAITSQHEWGGEFGGPIRKDKLWFFGDYRRTDRTEQSPALAGIVDPIFNGNIYLGKLTWLANRKNTFTATWQGRRNNWVPANADASITEDAGGYIFNTQTQDNYLFKWSSALGSQLLLEGRYGINLGGGSDREIFWNADPNRAGFVDNGTGKVFGWWRSDRWNKNRDAWVGKVDLTYFNDALLGGKHELKVGYENERDPFQQILHYPESLTHFLLNGRPDSVTLYVEPLRGARRITRNAFYVNDQWTSKDVTLNLGLRFDTSEGWTPGHTDGGGLQASDEPPRDSVSIQWFPAVTFEGRGDIWNMSTWAPRLGAVWDMWGQHKYVLKFSFGRWYDRVLSVPIPSGGSATYEWRDVNGDGRFQAGEQGALRSSSVRTSGAWDPSQIVDPNLKNPYTDSYDVGMEVELSRGYALVVTGIFKRETDLIGQITPARPESAYKPIQAVNPLSGQPITIYALDPAFRTASAIRLTTNPPGLKRTYNGLEIVGKKRFDGKSQVQVSLNLGKAEGNQGTNFGASAGGIDYSNPNLRTNFFGPTDLDAKVIFKAAGTYVLPYEINLSGYYQYISGYPLDTFNGVHFAYGGLFPGSRIGRFYREDFPGQIVVERFVDVALEPRGSFRQEAQHNFSVRLEKSFDLRPGRLGVILDVINLTNSGTVTHIQDLRTDARVFGLPEVIVLPRTARIGVRFSF
jgi:hypothetical protein